MALEVLAWCPTRLVYDKCGGGCFLWENFLESLLILEEGCQWGPLCRLSRASLATFFIWSWGPADPKMTTCGVVFKKQVVSLRALPRVCWY